MPFCVATNEVIGRGVITPVLAAMKEIALIQQLYGICIDQTTTRISARQRSMWTAAAAVMTMIQEQMPRRPCAEESTTTPRAPDTESSPTKSPLKKKVRRSAVRRRPLRYTAEGGISNEESTNSSDKEEDEVGEDATIHQQFATALSFLDADDGGHDDTAEQVHLVLLFLVAAADVRSSR